MTDTLIAYIQENFMPQDIDAPLTADTLLIQSGLLDSLSIFKMITFIQTHFSIKIEPSEIALENFATIQAIAMLVESKQQG